MFSRFQVMLCQLTAVLENWRFFSPIFRGRGEKFSKVGFQPWPNPNFVCKFRGDPLRDGRDWLSRKSGPKQINKGNAQKTYSRLAGYARRAAQLVCDSDDSTLLPRIHSCRVVAKRRPTAWRRLIATHLLNGAMLLRLTRHPSNRLLQHVQSLLSTSDELHVRRIAAESTKCLYRQTQQRVLLRTALHWLSLYRKHNVFMTMLLVILVVQRARLSSTFEF